jgi:hypothetical protein
VCLSFKEVIALVCAFVSINYTTPHPIFSAHLAARLAQTCTPTNIQTLTLADFALLVRAHACLLPPVGVAVGGGGQIQTQAETKTHIQTFTQVLEVEGKRRYGGEWCLSLKRANPMIEEAILFIKKRLEG